MALLLDKSAAQSAPSETSGPGEKEFEVSPGNIIRSFKDPYLELLRLLREATEIEHSLMVQYLYAAFSIKDKYIRLRGDGTSTNSDKVNTDCPATNKNADSFLGLAIQEMQHMHTVNMMMSRLGGAPNLHRQDFPFEPDIYPFKMHLQRLDARSLAKYVYTEASADSIKPDRADTPEEQAFLQRLYEKLGRGKRPNQLGSLYGTILNLTEEVIYSPPSFIKDAQTELKPWLEKLEKIKVNGETDHFRFLSQVFMGKHISFPDSGNQNIWDVKDEKVFPSHKVSINPSAYKGHKNEIKNDEMRELAWLGNLHYWIVLGLLNMTYRYDDWTDPFDGKKRNYLELAQRHMKGPLLKLGLRLAELKVGHPFDTLSMGYSFGRDISFTKYTLSQMVIEASHLARKLENSLPNGFKLSIYELTLGHLI